MGQPRTGARGSIGRPRSCEVSSHIKTGPEGCAKHICGTRAPEPLIGPMDKNEAEGSRRINRPPNAHLRIPGPSPHRRSGRDKKADRADHGIRSRANTRRARTGDLICHGRSHLPFRPKWATGSRKCRDWASRRPIRDSTAPLFQINRPSQVSGISVYPAYNRRLGAGASRQVELPGELNLLEVGYLRLRSPPRDRRAKCTGPPSTRLVTPA